MNEQNRKQTAKHHSAANLKDKLKQSLSVPSPTMLCFLGFALVRCSNVMMDHHFALSQNLGPLWGEDLYSLVSILVFSVCALFARKIAPLYTRKHILHVAVVFSIVAAVLDFLLSTTDLPSSTILLACIVFSGVSGALFILLWAELHSCLDPFRIVFYVSGAFLLGALGAWVLQDVEGTRRLFVLACCPLASAWCLVKSFSYIQPINLPRSLWGQCKFPWKLIVVLGIYEFVYGVRESSPNFAWETYLLGAIAMALAVFSFACLFARRSDFTLLYRTPFALTFCGLAMTPLTATFGGVFSDFLVSAGYALMFLIVTLLMCDLSRQRGVSVLVLCGMQEITATFRLVGHQASDAASSTSTFFFLNSEALEGFLTLAVVVASIVLLSDRNPSQTWGASFFGVGAMAKMDDDETWLEARCQELSQAYGLSPRECEVFNLLARGKTATQIERELVIANGTVKSHTRRIYQKFGIHTKRELVEMIGTKE